MTRPIFWIFAILLGSMALAACADDDDDAPSCRDDQEVMDGECVPVMAEGWTQIRPGGDTICSFGTEFSYWVKKGTVNKVVIGFDGGGACWSGATCNPANPIFSPEADDDPNDITSGVFDFDNPENPFKDWHIILIPYCSGDIHWGDNTHTYTDTGEEITVHHRGFVNAQSAIHWMYDGFDKPDAIFITGVSAGSYGSLMHTPYVMEHYTDTRVVQLGDCGAGVITDAFKLDSFPKWGALEHVPDWIPGIANRPLEELDLAEVYIEGSKFYPDKVFAQYNTNNDENQRFYYLAMGGDEADWSANMNEQIDRIADEAPNFRYYTAGGELHGILPYPAFYEYMADGVRLRDWVSDLVEGEPVENVHCVDCDEPQIYNP